MINVESRKYSFCLHDWSDRTWLLVLLSRLLDQKTRLESNDSYKE